MPKRLVLKTSCSTAVVSKIATAVLQPLQTGAHAGKVLHSVGRQNVETQVSEAVVSEPLGPQPAQHNNRSGRRGVVNAQQPRSRGGRTSAHRARWRPSAAFPGRQNVASSFTALVVVGDGNDTWSALAAVRLRKFRSNLQGCRGNKKNFFRVPRIEGHHPAHRVPGWRSCRAFAMLRPATTGTGVAGWPPRACQYSVRRHSMCCPVARFLEPDQHRSRNCCSTQTLGPWRYDPPWPAHR